jgi:hypothetical protein
MKLKIGFSLILLLLGPLGQAQNAPLDLAFEFQAYPTGLIPGIRLEKNFGGKNAAHLRLGYQAIDHRDLGKQDDETGQGWGFSLGYHRYFKPSYQGFFLGARNDIWFNRIDWANNDGTSGQTDITVLQPTAQAGWLFLLGKKFLLCPTLSFGYEINVKTEGEPTGEGAILLLGINLGHRF